MKSALKRVFFRIFLLLDQLGWHVLPKHYYSPVPDYTWLKRHRSLWTGRTTLSFEWDLEKQLNWLADVCRPYYAEVTGLRIYQEAVQHRWGPGFGPMEAQVLHCFMRKFAPPRVIEVGSGVSTECLLKAVEHNRREGRTPSAITCVEPFPGKALRDCAAVRLIEKPAQELPLMLFDELESGDLLFLDSTHAVKLGSEVPRLYLEIIPRLKPGVFIHVHDIHLPYLYPRDALRWYHGWQETALLAALLTGNSHLSTLCCLSALHYDRRKQLGEVLTDYQPQPDDEGLAPSPTPPGHFPASIWLRVL